MTAIDWLINQITEHKKKFGIPPTETGYMNLLEQAKQKEDQKGILVELMELDTKDGLYEQPEARFTEKDLRFAYMQGYNRGKDNNSNHMEEYITYLKNQKK